MQELIYGRKNSFTEVSKNVGKYKFGNKPLASK